ncbi:MAG: family 20 glycosylhydrolase [Firmicutes bacterium]|nr:family 20 glycosylhydrolase [Bacillota bacterium]
MNILPTPKKIEIKEGFLKSNTIKIKNMPEDVRIKNALDIFVIDNDGVLLQIFMGNSLSEAYTILIECEKITITSDGAAGVFYAIQTLKQIFTHDKIPCCYIEDAPDFAYRGFYHDVTRGKVPKISTIKKLIDNMAYYKLNSLQLYVEHTFEFKEFADSIDRTGYLTAEEIREIDDYCRSNFIEFIPSLSTFGHLYELLQKDRYKDLREIEDFKDGTLFWEDRMNHHTIDPTKEESFELIKRLIDQYIVNFSSDKFNICCDETFDLKNGKHKDEDTGKLYIDFVTKIIKYVQGKGKTPMMWADILLNYPEQIDKLPENVILLNWYYWKSPDEKTFKTIRDAKRTQIVCPGTSTWSRLCEDYELEIVNISEMAEYGYKYGAKGVLNTNWGDWGNPCSIELSMFGLVFGAEKSWNVSKEPDEDYIKSVNWLLYKNEKGNEYIKKLSSLCSKINWNELAKCYGNLLAGEARYDIEYPTEQDVSYVLDEGAKLIAHISSEKGQTSEYGRQIILAAEGTMVMAELFALQSGYKIKRITDTKKWLEKYKEKWLEANKKSELSEIEKMFITLDKND